MTPTPRCTHCNKTIADHKFYTREDYEAAKRATWKKPVELNGHQFYNPISESCIGEWAGHVPFIPGEDHTWRS